LKVVITNSIKAYTDINQSKKLAEILPNGGKLNKCPSEEDVFEG
jgi:hypothetical protein